MEATTKIQIVRVEIVRDFDKSYYANLYDENGGSHSLSKEYTDFRTLKTLCKKEYGVNLPNLSQIELEKYGRKSYAHISTETPQISTEATETVNVSVEGEKEAERAIYAFISKAETTLDKIKQKCLNREIYVEDASRYEFMVCMAVSNFVNKHKNRPIQPPQPPGTPQATECTADSGCRVCSRCGKYFHEGWFLGDEYACSEECAVALYGGNRELFEADLEMEENEPGTTECYRSVW